MLKSTKMNHMKKLLLFLLLSISTNTIFSQTYFRTYSLTIGKMQDNNTISWEEKVKTDPILIEFKEDKVTIFSKTEQIYELTGGQTVKKTLKKVFIQYDCIDERGKKCIVSIMNLKKVPDVFCIGVGYNDITWFYETIIEK
jgi:hypothetical protein